MKTTIAKKMLEAILYDNDMVNRSAPLNEAKFKYWVERVSQDLEAPVKELGVSFFTDEWIDDFCCGDECFIQEAVGKHSCLVNVNTDLNMFFENYEEDET